MRTSQLRLFWSQDNRSQGRENEDELWSLERRLRRYSVAITDIASAVTCSICIEKFAPAARPWNRNPIVVSLNGRHVAHNQEQRAVPAFAKICINGVRTVIDDDPLKSIRVVVGGIERLRFPIQGVEIDNQALDAPMERIIKQVPLDRPVAVPFVPLGDFSAHEQELFTRECPHPTEICPEVGEL